MTQEKHIIRNENGQIIINSLLKGIELIKDQIRIILVSNIKDQTKTGDYSIHSVATEFFSEIELEELITGFRQFGFYLELFTDEIDFIKAVITNQFSQTKKQYNIVYNTSQRGTGPGRKSLIPAFCNLHNIPTVNSNAYVVSLCRHKFHINCILQSLGIKAAKSWFFDKKYGWLFGKQPKEKTLIIAKPTYESASIGIDSESILIFNNNTHKKLEELSKIYNQPITVQQFIDGYEVEVPLLILDEPNAILPVGIKLNDKKLLGKEILTYDIIYNDLYSFYIFDEVQDYKITEIVKTAENVANIIGIKGFGRVDFRIDINGNYYVTDVATNPHITKHGSFFHLFNHLGYQQKDLLATLIALTCRDFQWIKC